jgi:hypothetical protein
MNQAVHVLRSRNHGANRAGSVQASRIETAGAIIPVVPVVVWARAARLARWSASEGRSGSRLRSRPRARTARSLAFSMRTRSIKSDATGERLPSGILRDGDKLGGTLAPIAQLRRRRAERRQVAGRQLTDATRLLSPAIDGLAPRPMLLPEALVTGRLSAGVGCVFELHRGLILRSFAPLSWPSIVDRSLTADATCLQPRSRST